MFNGVTRNLTKIYAYCNPGVTPDFLSAGPIESRYFFLRGYIGVTFLCGGYYARQRNPIHKSDH